MSERWTWQRKGCRVNDADGRKVADVNVAYCDEAELNRRGRLIAAAPCLLAAAIRALPYLEDAMARSCGDVRGMDGGFGDRLAYDALETAIARALQEDVK